MYSYDKCFALHEVNKFKTKLAFSASEQQNMLIYNDCTTNFGLNFKTKTVRKDILLGFEVRTLKTRKRNKFHKYILNDTY